MAGSTRVQALDKTGILNTVTHYLAQKKNWQPHEFRTEFRGLTPDEKCAVVWAVDLPDETNLAPGADNSVELHVDRRDNRVVKELRFQ